LGFEGLEMFEEFKELQADERSRSAELQNPNYLKFCSSGFSLTGRCLKDRGVFRV